MFASKNKLFALNFEQITFGRKCVYEKSRMALLFYIFEILLLKKPRTCCFDT